MLAYLVVLIEGALALAALFAALRPGRAGWGSRFLRGTLLGMACCAFLHGFGFGVLQVEGPHGRDDPLLLAGYGLIASFFPGLLLGMILGFVLARGRRPPGTGQDG